MEQENEKTEYKELGERIKQALEAADIKQRELARMLDVSDGSISAYTKGDTRVAPLTLAKIAQICGVSLEWLILGKGEMAPCGQPRPEPGHEIVAPYPLTPEERYMVEKYRSHPPEVQKILFEMFFKFEKLKVNAG